MKKPLREYLADLTEFVNVNRILRIGRRATKKAQEDNRRMGIPNVYSINGQLYYELPNGELTTEDPMAGQTQESEDTHSENDSNEAKPSDEQSESASSTETDASSTETTEGTGETAITPPKSHAGKNGAVMKPKSRTSSPSAKPTATADE